MLTCGLPLDARNADRRDPPPGIIVFIIADIASFALFFIVFMAERRAAVDLFDRSSRMLDVGLGLANTLILITSGWFVALAGASAKRGEAAAARRLFGLAAFTGVGFGVIKAVEYAGKLSAGLGPATDAFFTFYFVLTGLHFLHYLVGMALLVTVAFGGLQRLSNYPVWLESIALYWHMVDVIWVLLFPLLYLQGRA